MSKSMRAILLSLVTACLCLGLCVAATYALFSDSVTVNNHLQAGSLTVGLKRISYQTCTPDENGLLAENGEDTSEVDLTKDASVLFSVANAVPGCWYRAGIRVTNEGDVAFTYGVRLLWEADTATDEQKAFAGQIRITITAGDQSERFLLTEAEDVDLGSLAAGGSQTFTVTAEFTDDEDNNLAQNIELNFDLQVYAVQKTV